MKFMASNHLPPNNSGGNDHSDNEDIYANLLTYDVAGEKLKRHPNTIRNMVKREELENKKIGRTPYVFKDQIEGFGKRNGK